MNYARVYVIRTVFDQFGHFLEREKVEMLLAAHEILRDPIFYYLGGGGGPCTNHTVAEM